jgi:cell division protein FtsL
MSQQKIPVLNEIFPVKRYWGLFMTLVLIAMASALMVIWTTHVSRQLLNELQQLEKERNRLQVEWGQLLLEQSSMVSQGRVEDMAHQLGMRIPAMDKVVVIKSE